MFVLSSLGSRWLRAQDRAPGEPPQGRGRARDARLPQRTRTRSSHGAARRAAAQARAPRQVFVRRGVAPAPAAAARAARDGDRGESLPGAVRGLRDAAAVASAAHRGAGEHLDVPRPPPAEAPLPVGAGAFRSDRAWLAGAACVLGRSQSARTRQFHRHLQRCRLRALRAHDSLRGGQAPARVARRQARGAAHRHRRADAGRRRTRKCC